MSIKRFGLASFLFTICLVLPACASGQVAESTPTATFTITPTPLGGGNGQIIFSMQDPSSGHPCIYLMDSDGTHVTKLNDGKNFDVNPAYSPDGQHIAFVSVRNKKANIYVMNKDGSHEVRLTSGTSDREPAWSPDGTHIVYSSYSSSAGSPTPLYIMKSDGSENIQLTKNESDYSPSWSPDGNYIVFTAVRYGDYVIEKIKTDGTGETQLTDLDAADPSWSPDGKHIVFTYQANIFVMDPDGKNAMELTHSQDKENYFPDKPSWSADGLHIIFENFGVIEIMNADGSDIHELTGTQTKAFDPKWRSSPAQPTVTASPD